LKALMLTSRLVAGVLVLAAFAQRTSANTGKVNLAVDCHCADSVGKRLCTDFKGIVADSPGYQLTEGSSGYGIGVHLSCVDLLGGLENRAAGQMSAVSISFTIFSDKLPGEIYEDSSVFRVGKNATEEMSRKILAAIGQLVSTNENLFQHLREAGQKPSPSPSR